MDGSLIGKSQLVCVMHTDTLGYHTLLEKNPFLANQISEKFLNIQFPIIQAYGGQLIKDHKNGILATFDSSTDSVLAAVAIQNASRIDNKIIPRIGIHLCEVNFEYNNIIGPGVELTRLINNSAPLAGVYITEFVKSNLINKKGIIAEFVSNMTFNDLHKEVPVYQLKITGEYIDRNYQLDKPVELKKLNPKSIAVLPFVNLNKDPEVEYFGDGMAEDILNTISNFPGFNVVCRTSSFQFKEKNKDLKEIAQILDVGTLIIGSADKQDDKLFVTVQLMDVETNLPIWKENYEEKFSDIFKLQDKISNEISQKLQVKLLDKNGHSPKKAPTDNLLAYDLFLKGQFYWNKRGRWLMNGLQFFKDAIEADPNFALAHAGLADAYAALGMYGIVPPAVSMPKAKQFAFKAIELNPNISHAYTTLGFIYGFHENDQTNAVNHFEKGIELNPKGAMEHYWYSMFLSVVAHDYQKAEEIGIASVLIEPHNAIACHIAGLALLAQKKYDDALILAKKSIEIDSSLFLPYFLAGWCQIQKGNYQLAIDSLNIALNLSGRHSWAIGFLILAKLKIGELNEAEILLQEVITRENAGYFPTFGAVIAALAFDNEELALGFLERGHKNQDILISILTHFDVLPENLRSDAKILSFLKEINLLN